MAVNTLIFIFIPTIVLGVAAYFDYRTRTIPNRWLAMALAATAVIVLLAQGTTGLKSGVLSSTALSLFFLPLYLSKTVGAGDLKLAGVFAFSMDWSSALWASVYALVWAAVLGVAMAIVKGQGRVLVSNTIAIVRFAKPNPVQLHKIPFAVAFLAGWLTQLSALAFGGAL